MKALFHLGMPKTGTSILQNCVVRSLPTTGAHVMLPRTGRDAAIAHHDLVRRIRSSTLDDIDVLASRLGDEALTVRKEDPSKSILFCTSEEFTNICGAKDVYILLRFLRGFEDFENRQAVLVVRELSDFLESMYLQTTRVRSFDMSFSDYVHSRKRWIEYLFQGIRRLKEQLGPDLCLEYMVPGFDVLSVFENLLGYQRDGLQQYAGSVPSTAKRSLMEQVCLSNLSQLESEIGFKIERKKLIAYFNNNSIFESDLNEYTLYKPKHQYLLNEEVLSIAKRNGFTDYIEAFGAHHIRDRDFVDLDFSRLSLKDLEALKVAKDVIVRQ